MSVNGHTSGRLRLGAVQSCDSARRARPYPPGPARQHAPTATWAASASAGARPPAPMSPARGCAGLYADGWGVRDDERRPQPGSQYGWPSMGTGRRPFLPSQATPPAG